MYKNICGNIAHKGNILKQLDGLRKESFSSRIYWYKSQKFKSKKQKQTNKQEQDTQGLWDNYQRCNVPIVRLSEGEEREKSNKKHLK